MSDGALRAAIDANLKLEEECQVMADQLGRALLEIERLERLLVLAVSRRDQNRMSLAEFEGVRFDRNAS